MKKCGLRKAYAMGGELGEMDPTELAQFTNNPDVLNAASTRKWTMEEAAQQAKYPGRAFIDPVTKQDIGRAHRGLGMALQESGMVAPPQPQAQRPMLQSPQLPMETTFQQDIDARQQRMAGYRAKLGYAGGGTIDPDALMREMAAKYGTSGAQPQVAAPTPQPAPAPVQAPQPKPTLLDGLRRLATGNLEGRMKAAGFKQGGTVDGKGYIHGEKGVDKVPAKVAETGEDILVSDGERIVNKKQNAALERLAAEAGMSLDEYLEQSTGEPVGPQMKRGLRAAEQGWNRVHMPGDRVSVDFNPVKPKPDLVKPVEQDPFAFRGGDRGVPGPSNGPDSTALTPVPPVAKPVVPTATPSVNTDAQEAMRETAMAGLGGQQGLRNAKSMDYLQSMGVDTSKRFAPRDDVNTVNANGPERVRGGAVTTINTQNGPVYAGRDGKGQLVVTSGLDRSDAEQAAATKSGYDQAVAQAQKDKDSLARIQRERAEFDAFDPSITDPAARQNGLRQVAMNMMKDEAANKALQHKEDRDAMLGLRRDMLEEQKRQFDVAALASEAAARRTAQKEGIKEFDDLVKSAGYEGDEATKFTDWFRGNYAGRRHKINGEEVDVKGFEDMSPDEKRAHMTNAKAQYEWIKQLNQTEMSGKTSMATPKGLRPRKLNFDDVARHTSGIGKGLPVLHSDDPNAPGLLGKGGLVNRLWVPEMLGGASDQVVEEIDANGSPLRKWLKSNTRGEQGPWGTLDTAAHIDSITRK